MNELTHTHTTTHPYINTYTYGNKHKHTPTHAYTYTHTQTHPRSLYRNKTNCFAFVINIVPMVTVCAGADPKNRTVGAVTSYQGTKKKKKIRAATSDPSPFD